MDNLSSSSSSSTTPSVSLSTSQVGQNGGGVGVQQNTFSLVDPNSWVSCRPFNWHCKLVCLLYRL